MTNQHTSGPWFYDDSLKGRLVINSERANVAVIPYLDQEAIANARLIAAAPELLAAVKVAAEFCRHRGGSWADFQTTINAAIDKVENGGRS